MSERVPPGYTKYLHYGVPSESVQVCHRSMASASLGLNIGIGLILILFMSSTLQRNSKLMICYVVV